MGLYKVVLALDRKLELEQISSRKVYLEGPDLTGTPDTLILNGGGVGTTDWTGTNAWGLPTYWVYDTPP